ncbi:MAG: DUF1579 domain-containing protein [Acidobacteriota bacterium]|nr:DUF1579 domain-containing protein [Acidobacteriota bacterium]
MEYVISARIEALHPQPEHELLKRFAGEWQFEKRSAPADGAPPQRVGSGSVEAEMLGGFFVVCKWSGDLYETDFKAVQTLGYDVDKGRYSGSWVDSIMSYRWQYDGSLEAVSKELVITAGGPGPGDDTAKFRERYRFDSADTITVVARMLQDGQWVTFMTTHLTRKK